MSGFHITLATLLIGALGFLWQRRRRRRQFRARSKGYPLPPGPTKFPVIGNLFDIPKCYMWETFLQWKYRYGEVSSMLLIRPPFEH